MNNYINNLKKRLIYRSLYRGTKEMDKLIGSFVKKYIDKFDEKELKDLEKFLNNDDDTLYKIYNKELDINDSNETKLIVDQPTADRIVTIPNATGTIVLRTSTDTLTNPTNMWGFYVGDATSWGALAIDQFQFDMTLLFNDVFCYGYGYVISRM